MKTKFLFHPLLILGILVLTITACKKEENKKEEKKINPTTATEPVLTTSGVTLITDSSAQCGGTITSDGGATVTARGIVWSRYDNPYVGSLIIEGVTSNGTGAGTFTTLIKKLISNTTYYVRAYATNSVGTAYGDIITFSTKSGLPTLDDSYIYRIQSTKALCESIVRTDGGLAVTARGVCWNTSASPTISNNKTTDSLGTGPFTSSIKALISGKTYYVRAYATNSFGTAYSNEMSFTTAYGLGESYQGGIIAYILQPGETGYVAGETHGLIAAPSDQSSGIRWHNGIASVLNASSLYDGKTNTNNIVMNQGAGSYAAKLCYDLTLGGYNDWYLPSINELESIYKNRGLIGGFQNTWYWSSTAYYGYGNQLGEAWCLHFNDFTDSTEDEGLSLNVRAFRAF